MSWDDDTRAQAVSEYKEAEPTAETSGEIVKQIAENMGVSANGVRAVLSKAGVYIKKTPTSTSSGKKPASKRVSKADQQKLLIDAISASGLDADTEIIEKLSGKAAAYLAGVVLYALADVD